MKRLKKQNGFTLVELMIVLAVIAILVVVLVPKSTIFKKQARNQGVVTNANVVRAYLESKTDANFIKDLVSPPVGLADDLEDAMTPAFTDKDAIVNPSSQVTTIVTTEPAAAASAGSVYIANGSTVLAGIAECKGVVVIEVYASGLSGSPSGKGYKIYGVDLDGAKMPSTEFTIY